MIAQKYRVGWRTQTGLDDGANRALGQQWSNADEMFETLFTEVRRLATLLAAAGGAGGGSGSAVAGYWTVLTDGDVDETQLIFAGGEAIAVFVPTP